MPIYDWRRDSESRPPWARFFDAATGEEVRGVFRWDSDTDRVDRFAVDDAGNYIVDNCGDVVIVAEVRVLRVEWKDAADTPYVVPAG